MKEKNAQVVFKNLTLEQAKSLASWFHGTGEQYMVEWFDISEIECPHTKKSFTKGNIVTVEFE